MIFFTLAPPVTRSPDTDSHTDSHTDTHTQYFFRDFEDLGPGGALGPVRPPSSSISQRMDEEYGGDNAYAGTFKSTPHGMDTNE